MYVDIFVTNIFCQQLVTGIALPVGSDKLYSGSSDGTLRAWDCHTGQCIGLNNLGAEVTCLVAEGPWIFAALGNGTIMVSPSAYFCPCFVSLHNLLLYII